MQRPPIAFFLSFAATLAFATSAVAQSNTTSPVIAVGDSIPNLASRIAAELRTIGFDVVAATQVPPGDLRPAIVAIVRPSESGEAIEVWIRDTTTGVFTLLDRVMPIGTGEQADGGWAIRAVESVRGSLLEIGIEPSPSEAEVETPELTQPELPQPEPEPTQPEIVPPEPARVADSSPRTPKFAAGGGVRFLFVQGGASTTALGTLGGRWSPTDHSGVILDVGAPVVRARLEASEGTAVLQPYMASVGGSYTWGRAAIVPSVEGGARVVWLRMRGDASPPYEGHADEAWLGGPWIGVSARRRLTSIVHVRLELSALWATPNTDVTFVEHEVGSWGKGIFGGGLFLQVAP